LFNKLCARAVTRQTMTVQRTRAFAVGAVFALHAALAVAQALPQGNTGIASRYPGDADITSDSAVIFADDFESYAGASALTSGGRWSNYYQGNQTRISSAPGTFLAGGKALEFTMPQTATEVANAVVKNLPVEEDVLFVRAYTKFEAGFDGTTEGHNGIRISGRYPGPGNIPNGSNFFLYMVENSVYYGEPYPGPTNVYAYHPEQRSQWGDHFYPTGSVLPFDRTPGNFGPTFVQRPNFTPQTDRWYSYELMVKLNTPGQRDGRVAVWIDGNLIADYPNLRMRDTTSVKIDQMQLELHAKSNPSRADRKWYDNVVVARSYIGPMSAAAAAPLPAPTNLRVQ
jgi:hypothetical protein